MEITEVRLTLVNDADDRLQAFCSITFDNSFVVRDLKIIDGANGLFVAMPARKVSRPCQRCGGKNHITAIYCDQCGERFQAKEPSAPGSNDRVHVDVAHPISKSCREMIQKRVIEELQIERGKRLPTQLGQISIPTDHHTPGTTRQGTAFE